MDLYSLIRYNKNPGWWDNSIHPDIDQDIWALVWYMKLKEETYDRCVHAGIFHIDNNNKYGLFHYARKQGCFDQWVYLHKEGKWLLDTANICALHTLEEMYEGCINIFIRSDLHQKFGVRPGWRISWLLPNQEIEYEYHRVSFVDKITLDWHSKPSLLQPETIKQLEDFNNNDLLQRNKIET